MDFIYCLMLSYWTPIKVLKSRPLWSWVLHRFHVFSVQSNATLQCHKKAHTPLTSSCHTCSLSMSIHLCVFSLSPCLERALTRLTCTSHFNLIFFFHFGFWVLFVRALTLPKIFKERLPHSSKIYQYLLPNVLSIQDAMDQFLGALFTCMFVCWRGWLNVLLLVII